jgi:hypothetical protein
MKNRAVRIALFLLVVLALAGAGYELAMLDRQAATTREAGRVFEDKARQVDAAVRELKAAQYAYVAAGQGSAFWTARVATLLPAIAEEIRQLSGLEKAALDAGLQPHGPPCAAALDDLTTLQRIDASAQAYLRDDQRLLASDLVFSDLREAGQAMAGRIEEARSQMVAARDAALEPLRRKQIATSAGAALFAVLVLLLLVPGGGRSTSRPGDIVARTPVEAVAHAPARPQPRAAAPADPAPTRSHKTATPSDETASGIVGTRVTPVPVSVAVDLSATAVLCSDFARVRQGTELPALLERAGALLDAAGIVIWVHDPANGGLRPALSFGYAPQALARIRAIPGDDDNATASAYRERKLRVVEGHERTNGAIAAPLLAADGCLGVMAAEIRGGRERHTDVQAVATILAAQLATLVAPAEERSEK